MSLYTTWINLIKEKANEDWLTDSQRKVYERILSKWKTHSFINLHGPSGSGKSFITRLLAKKNGYYYAHSLEDTPRSTVQVILDNAQYTRQLRSIARERDLGRVLLITRNPVNEAMPRLSLELTEKDIRQFQAVLSKYCNILFTHTIPEGIDLGEIIRKEIIKRGENDVH